MNQETDNSHSCLPHAMPSNSIDSNMTAQQQLPHRKMEACPVFQHATILLHLIERRPEKLITVYNGAQATLVVVGYSVSSTMSNNALSDC